MGSLTPGATYIYESVDGRIYAREFGKTERRLIGYDPKLQETAERRQYMTEMNNVLQMCETDPAMKDLLDKLMVMYNIKKEHK